MARGVLGTVERDGVDRTSNRFKSARTVPIKPRPPIWLDPQCGLPKSTLIRCDAFHQPGAAHQSVRMRPISAVFLLQTYHPGNFASQPPLN
jgi:hypothetical protein